MKFYTSIFRRSWLITKHHPALWLFGLFTLFWSGKSLDLELFYTHVDLLSDVNSPFNPAFWDSARWSLLVDSFGLTGARGAVFLLVLLVLALFVLGLILVAQIGLLDAFGKSAEKHDTTVRYTAGNAFDAAGEHFWPIVAVNIGGKVLAYGLVALASIPLFVSAWTSTSQVFWSWLLLAVGTPVAVVLSIIVKYATNYIVNGDEKAIVAVWKGWVLFKKNVGISIEQSLAMMAAFVASNIAALITTSLVTLPFALAAQILALWFGSEVGFSIMYIVFYVVGIFALTMTSMIFSAWHHGCWTLLYFELQSGGKRSKTHRLWKGE